MVTEKFNKKEFLDSHEHDDGLQEFRHELDGLKRESLQSVAKAKENTKQKENADDFLDTELSKTDNTVSKRKIVSHYTLKQQIDDMISEPTLPGSTIGRENSYKKVESYAASSSNKIIHYLLS